LFLFIRYSTIKIIQLCLYSIDDTNEKLNKGSDYNKISLLKGIRNKYKNNIYDVIRSYNCIIFLLVIKKYNFFIFINKIANNV